jgi:bleomycin hydrolase
MPKSATSVRKRRTIPDGTNMRHGTAQLTARLLATMQSDFASNPTHKIIQNAVTQVTVKSIAASRDIVTTSNHSFSITLDDWKTTHQEASGRCWMFAGLNFLRAGAIKKMNIKEFEFSQNFILFWDQLEKANYFLEAVIETADRDVDDRTVAFLLNRPTDDAGQWSMLMNIIHKYGLVPKAAMPETQSSSHTHVMCTILISKLREGAKTLRDLHGKKADLRKLRAAKNDILKVIHRILSIHLGTPPATFDWQWTDRKKKFHRDAHMTPPAFAEKYVTVPLDEYVCLMHDPRKTSPARRMFTVQYLGNVVEGQIVSYLNVDIALMKKIALRTLQSGEPVWFGCDVAKQLDEKRGVWDADLHDFEAVYDTTFNLDKAGRLDYGETRMTHAMVFTGVDVVRGKPRRWRVENSWGDTCGQKGFYLMNDSWFDEHMFEMTVRRKYLPARFQAALKTKPIVLPPWDPMGSLAESGAIRRL